MLAEFTGFMDLVQRALNQHGFANVRLDGTLAQKQRAKVVTEFTTSKQPSILVASLKAGGVGLNLIAATRVYVMDLWWNAAVESQAIDRIHRFGQTREVFVTRFLGEWDCCRCLVPTGARAELTFWARLCAVDESIDGKMAKLQLRKTAVVNNALGGEAGKKGNKQLQEDLALIFGDD